MLVSEVGYLTEISQTWAKELRACHSATELQRMIDTRWSWLPDAGGIAHMLCRRTFREFVQWRAMDDKKRKSKTGKLASDAYEKTWLAGAHRFGALMVPARLLALMLKAQEMSVCDGLVLKRLVDTGQVAAFFDQADKGLFGTGA